MVYAYISLEFFVYPSNGIVLILCIHCGCIMCKSSPFFFVDMG